MRSRFAAAGIALALTAASALTLAQAPAGEAGARTPEQVVRHHFAAAAARDLEAVLSDYADDAVIITANGVVRGKDAVRATFTRMMRAPQRGARIAEASTERAGPQIVVSHFTRDVGWLMWAQNAGKPNEVRGVETYLVRAGRIELETVGTVALHPASTALPKQ